MRCSKSQIFLQHATMRFHKWNHTVACFKKFYYFFIHFFSLIYSLRLSLSLSHLEFLLFTYHFFSLAEAADFVEAIDLAIEIDLAWSYLKLISPNAA